MRGKRGKEEGKTGNAKGPDTRNGKSLQPEREREEKKSPEDPAGQEREPGTADHVSPDRPGRAGTPDRCRSQKEKEKKRKSQGTDQTAPRLFLFVVFYKFLDCFF